MGRFCSSDITTDPVASKGLSYWLCPHEEYCGDRVQVASFTEQVVEGSVQSVQMCTFIFVHGVNSGPTDVMRLEFTSIENA
jgi:hypothetical protein